MHFMLISLRYAPRQGAIGASLVVNLWQLLGNQFQPPQPGKFCPAPR